MSFLPDSLTRAAEVLSQARHVVVFSGAGISAASGIPTFRDQDGLWARFAPEQFANWPGLLKTAALRPRVAAEFLAAVLEPVARAKPNAAHRALARLEQHVPVTVITQNIDGLHQEAGSRVVYEIHGSLLQIVSLRGRPIRRLSRQELLGVVESLGNVAGSGLSFIGLLRALRPIFSFGPRGARRPSVVLFGQALAEPDWTLAQQAVRQCDCLLSVGSSGAVWPAAGLPAAARAAGARIIRVDPAEGEGDVWLAGAAIELVPALVARAFCP